MADLENVEEIDEAIQAGEASDNTEETTEEVESEEEAEETEAEDSDESEEEEEEQPAPKKQRASERIRTLSQRLKETEERHERQMAELRNQISQPQTRVNPVEEARIREEKLALMDPAERREFLRDEEIKALKQSQAITQMQLVDTADKAAYEAKATMNPVYAKHKDAVEKALAALRAGGNNASREELLKWVIGHEALNAKPSKPKQAAKQAAAVRVDAAKGKSTSARSDTTSYSGKGSTEEERLRNVFI